MSLIWKHSKYDQPYGINNIPNWSYSGASGSGVDVMHIR